MTTRPSLARNRGLCPRPLHLAGGVSGLVDISIAAVFLLPDTRAEPIASRATPSDQASWGPVSGPRQSCPEPTKAATALLTSRMVMDPSIPRDAPRDHLDVGFDCVCCWLCGGHAIALLAAQSPLRHVSPIWYRYNT